MNSKIYSIEGKEIGQIELPVQFREELRPDLIRRAGLAVQNSDRQRYGASTFAGKRASAELSKRRRKYRGCYGIGIARTPRKIISRRGTRLNWVGAFAPNTVGGRRAHPPISSKCFIQKINSKERKKAIRSAISNTHRIIIETKFEQLKKTSEVARGLKFILPLFGVPSLENKTKSNKTKKLLIVTSGDCPLNSSAKNLAVICPVHLLNALVLAPGLNAGRSVIWTQKAIEIIKERSLFI